MKDSQPSDIQHDAECGIDSVDGLRAEPTCPRPEPFNWDRQRLVALRPTVAIEARIAGRHRDNEWQIEGSCARRAGHRYDRYRRRATQPVRLDDYRRVRTAHNVTADFRQVDDVDVAARWTGPDGVTSDPYHSSFANSSAVIGAYARAISRFSSAWASSAASSRACSASPSVRRSAAAIVALTLMPLSAAAARTTSTTSAGRLMDNFTKPAAGAAGAYGATASRRSLPRDSISLMVGVMV
jgi:hypothetical protein